MKIKLIAIISLLILASNMLFAYSNPNLDKKIKIAVTTSNLAVLINEICKDKVDVITIIPTTICPGNYDIDAQTIKEISQCNVVLYHYWQPWVKNLKFKISKLGIVYREVKTEGNMMIPYIQLRAAQELYDLLSIWDQDNKSFYEQNLLDYSFRVNFVTEEIMKNSYNKYNKKIVCNNKIAPFLQWLGFDVVATYGKADSITSAEMLFLTKKIKKEKVKYIVDNLQAGTDAGRNIAEDLKIKHVVISNFALGKSYINTLKNNIDKINKALEE